jgi:phage gp29-like protein
MAAARKPTLRYPDGRPTGRRAEAYPVIPAFRQYARKAEIDSILNQHSFGSFGASSQLIDEIMTDDRISGVVETRIGALLSAELEIRAARDKRKERKIAEYLGGIDDARGAWSSIVSPAAAFDILKWGLLNGVAVGQIIWGVGDQGEWLPRLCPWHPRHLRWDWNLRRFLIQTTNMGEVMLPDVEADPNGDGQWFIWAPHGQALGWLNGMVRSLALAYLGRQWNFRDWSRYNEKHGLAIVKATVPAWAKPQDVLKFLGDLGGLGSEGAIQCPVPRTKDEQGFDLSLLEAVSRSWESFKEFKSAIDTDIAVRVLGQNMTTEGGTNGGSRALGQVHDLVRLDKAIEDAGVGDAFSRQILGWYTAFNYGDRALAPSVIYHVEPAADAAKVATGWKTLGEAVIALKTGEPRVDVPAILEAEGIPLMTEEQLAAQKAAQQQQGQGDQPDGGQGDGADGADTGADGELTAQDMAEIKQKLDQEEGQPVTLTSVIVPAGQRPGADVEDLPFLDDKMGDE